MKTLRFGFLLTSLLCLCVLHGQVWDFPQVVAIGDAKVVTTITVRAVKYAYQAPVVLPTVWVLQGAGVKLQVGDWAANAAQISWYRQGTTTALGTGSSFELNNFQSIDAAVYYCVIKDAAGKETSSEPITLKLSYTPQTNTLSALSVLVNVTPAQPTVIFGFIVNKQTAAWAASKELLIRAVGPSLSKLGVSGGLAKPKLKLFKADGTEIPFNNIVRIPESPITIDTLQASVGLVPLDHGTKDIIQDAAFAPGAYTLHVSSEDGSAGTVLIELYEVPQS